MPPAKQTAAEKKITEYERFLNDQLKVDLQKSLEVRAVVQAERDSYVQLVDNIEALERDGTDSLRSMVNLGSEVYCQAEAPDTSTLFVNIGLGFHAQLTRVEAQAAARARAALIDKRIAVHDEEIAKIRAHIKLVAEGIRELSALPAEAVKKKTKTGFSA